MELEIKKEFYRKELDAIQGEYVYKGWTIKCLYRVPPNKTKESSEKIQGTLTAKPEKYRVNSSMLKGMTLPEKAAAFKVPVELSFNGEIIIVEETRLSSADSIKEHIEEVATASEIKEKVVPIIKERLYKMIKEAD